MDRAKCKERTRCRERPWSPRSAHQRALRRCRPRYARAFPHQPVSLRCLPDLCRRVLCLSRRAFCAARSCRHRGGGAGLRRDRSPHQFTLVLRQARFAGRRAQRRSRAQRLRGARAVLAALASAELQQMAAWQLKTMQPRSCLDPERDLALPASSGRGSDGSRCRAREDIARSAPMTSGSLRSRAAPQGPLAPLRRARAVGPWSCRALPGDRLLSRRKPCGA